MPDNEYWMIYIIYICIISGEREREREREREEFVQFVESNRNFVWSFNWKRTNWMDNVWTTDTLAQQRQEQEHKIRKKIYFYIAHLSSEWFNNNKNLKLQLNQFQQTFQKKAIRCLICCKSIWTQYQSLFHLVDASKHFQSIYLLK